MADDITQGGTEVPQQSASELLGAEQRAARESREVLIGAPGSEHRVAVERAFGELHEGTAEHVSRTALMASTVDPERMNDLFAEFGEPAVLRAAASLSRDLFKPGSPARALDPHLVADAIISRLEEEQFLADPSVRAALLDNANPMHRAARDKKRELAKRACPDISERAVDPETAAQAEAAYKRWNADPENQRRLMSDSKAVRMTAAAERAELSKLF